MNFKTLDLRDALKLKLNLAALDGPARSACEALEVVEVISRFTWREP